MSTGPGFEEYLKSKKIDSDAFKLAEPQVWNAWKDDFEQSHPNSFTVQKLNLINPVRRKYLLVSPEIKVEASSSPPLTASPVTTPKPGKPVIGKPVIGKPVIKPKPNTDAN